LTAELKVAMKVGSTDLLWDWTMMVLKTALSKVSMMAGSTAAKTAALKAVSMDIITVAKKAARKVA